MVNAKIVLQIRTKYKFLAPLLDERTRRCWAATEATTIGWGGISAVAQATGLSRNTILVGMKELEQAPLLLIESHEKPQRVRQPGAGRKSLAETAPRWRRDLKKLLDSSTRGDPQSPLKWTSKSCRKLAEELNRKGHSISPQTVAELWHQMDYSLQSNRKTREGTHHPDRDAQFKYLNKQVRAFQKGGQPGGSVDTKKRELMGDFQQKGRSWRPKGHPITGRVHDFEDPQLGHAIPYGVYDLTYHEGWVSIGIEHNTAAFAVETIRHWWYEMGRTVYPEADEWLVTADAGGSNGSRVRLWKVALQGLANELGLRIKVCLFPPGTSKWNKIEQRMFCHITKNWSGTPLVSRAVIVSLVGNTTTDTGLPIKAKLDLNSYP
jgi:hypothetical protein